MQLFESLGAQHFDVRSDFPDWPSDRTAEGMEMTASLCSPMPKEMLMSYVSCWRVFKQKLVGRIWTSPGLLDESGHPGRVPHGGNRNGSGLGSARSSSYSAASTEDLRSGIW